MTQPGNLSPVNYTTVLNDLTRHCKAGGLDLLQPLQAGWYNTSVREENRLDDFGNPASLVVLVANTRRLWPALISALKESHTLRQCSNPLDTHVEDTINTAVNAMPQAASVRWAHRPAPHHIAIQQMAEVAGLAWRSPGSLSIHPRYGPWIALRAAVVFAIPGPKLRPSPPTPCMSCETACINVLDSPNRGDWQHQLAVRDACPTGREYRYPDLQIEYHYRKSRNALQAAIDSTPKVRVKEASNVDVIRETRYATAFFLQPWGAALADFSRDLQVPRNRG